MFGSVNALVSLVASALFGALVVVVAGCGNPTELVVFVDTTLGVPCDVDRIELIAAGQTVERVDVSLTDQPASWTLVKGGGGDDLVISAIAYKGNTVVASAEAQASFRFYTSQSVHIVLDDACRDATCDFSDDVGSFRVPEAAARAACVPPVERYRVSDLTGLVDVVDACSLEGGPFQAFTGVVNNDVALDDEELVGLLADGFDFSFYGQPIERVWIADDGYLSFGADPADATFDRVTNTEGLSSAGHPTFAVVAFWENLAFPAAGRLCTGMVQGARDTLWTTWKSACLAPACAAGDRIEFSVGLEEVSNRVIVGFRTMASTTEPDRAAGGQAVVGIVGTAAAGCDASACDDEGLCADGVTPCGFTQVFSRTLQTDPWPATFAFDPVVAP